MGKKTKIGLTAAAVGAAAWAGSKALANPLVRPAKEVLNYEHPIVLAHRGGAKLAPENTLAAFNRSAELGVHGFEIDIRMTKDEELLVFHDEYIDRTTDGAGRVADMSLDQLKAFDLGYHFIDTEGQHSYRGKNERVVLLRELIEKFPQMYINIDIKDDPETYEGSLVPSKLWRLIDSLSIHDRVAVTSFYDEQIDRFNLYAQNRVAIGAGENEVRKAYASFNSQFGHLYQPRADVFQIPIKSSLFRLDSSRFIAFLENLNIPVHYWVIDEPEAMRTLIAAGAKGIITDRPDLAVALISEMEE
ncbi:glycerophosphoryl diester phosphodiesterase [Planococcus antarcticus DSM 14505]|uniref:Glycerophosphodiester phosphodiesterase n=1 Tax=Planococcus antarcticus DSM 14505 TaxID=1185653 RepID=A0A1C7DGC3_9BACL|nr:glycerophosphodiester phosphodiesterase [Planococcus antarcticus]ANU10452.1 glycerophosphodiester phosphodiesterase [Planococcus antarcticus DSM 14505]EIM07812.1 glycerophosphoryl diester phosphodiesterase [Planococcus antarcticus DSM 14505]